MLIHRKYLYNSRRMTSVINDSIKPPRYGGKGSFFAWKLKVLAYLQPLGLKDVVVNPELEDENVGTQSSSSSTSSKRGADASVASQRKAEKAYGILLNLLEDQLIDLIANVEPGNAHGVWKVLLETYEAKSTATLCHTLDLFMNITFKSESFDMYKARFLNLVQRLKEMGETVSPAIQRYVLLKGLPASYDSLVQSLKVNDKLTIEQVCIHIKDYYESAKRQPRDLQLVDLREDPTEMVALAAHKKRDNTCYTCGNTGHYSKNCAMNKKKEENKEEKIDYGHFFA